MSVLSPVLKTDLPNLLHRGKVRDTYRVAADLLLMVATDRVSAFDVVMDDPIPQKGILLARMSAFSFRNVIGDIIPNHMIAMTDDVEGLSEVGMEYAVLNLPDALRPRTMLIREAERIEIECVVRGFLAGAGWAEYKADGTLNGERLQTGLRPADRLSHPVFTPSTKAEQGHDRPLTRTEAIDLVGSELHTQLEELSIEIYERARDHAQQQGLILVDTKFEFGFVDGKITLIDEVLTPDSSRFWDADQWQPGEFPPAYDKQFLREWLLERDWDREPPPPNIPKRVMRMTRQRYVSAYERFTGESFEY